MVQRLFAFLASLFGAAPSVDNAIAGLNKAVTKLDDVVAHHTGVADELQKAVDFAKREASRAQTVRAKIADLVEG